MGKGTVEEAWEYAIIMVQRYNGTMVQRHKGMNINFNTEFKSGEE
jgi:hypothetical protein